MGPRGSPAPAKVGWKNAQRRPKYPTEGNPHEREKKVRRVPVFPTSVQKLPPEILRAWEGPIGEKPMGPGE